MTFNYRALEGHRQQQCATHKKHTWEIGTVIFCSFVAASAEIAWQAAGKTATKTPPCMPWPTNRRFGNDSFYIVEVRTAG